MNYQCQSTLLQIGDFNTNNYLIYGSISQDFFFIYNNIIFLQFTLNDPIERLSHSRGIRLLTEWSLLQSEFNPTLVLLLFTVIKHFHSWTSLCSRTKSSCLLHSLFEGYLFTLKLFVIFVIFFLVHPNLFSFIFRE